MMEHTVSFTKKTGKTVVEKAYAFGSAVYAGGTARVAAIQTIVPAALARVGNGRYREAFEIIEASMPTLAKRALKDLDPTSIAWANADSFAKFVWALVAAEGRNKSELSAKAQTVWDTLVTPLTSIPAIESRKPVVTLLPAKPKAAPRFTKEQLLSMLAALEEDSEEEDSEEGDSED